MADIFISYARPDESRATALQQRLEEAGWSVWRDQRLESGEDYRAQIEDALENARVTLVVWSSASIASQWVRSEASRAANRKRLMAVRIENVEPPLGLDQLQATNLITFRPGEAHEGVDTLLTQIAVRLGRNEKRREDDDAQAMRRLRRRLREAKTSTLLALAAAPLFLLVHGSGVLDSVLHMDARLRLLSLQARYLFVERKLDDRLAAVVIDDQTVEALRRQKRDGHLLDQFGASWRVLQAELLAKLAAAGAKAVVFDVAFPAPEPDAELANAGTDQFARTIRDARKQGTAVVVTAVARTKTPNAALAVDPRIHAALFDKSDGAPGYVASPCVGFRDGGATMAVVLTKSRSDPRWRGLSLAAVESLLGMSTTRLNDRRLWLSGPSAEREIPITGTGQEFDADSDCRVLGKGDQPALLLLDLYSEELKRGHPRVAMFEDMLNPSKPALPVRGKTVLVGTQLNTALGVDRYDIYQCGTTPWSCGDTKRWGMNLQLDAMNNLLSNLKRGTAITTLGPAQQLLLMLVLCMATAWLRLANGHRSVWVRRTWLGVAMACALLITVVAALAFQLLMDGAYHMLAMAATYYAVERLDK